MKKLLPLLTLIPLTSFAQLPPPTVFENIIQVRVDELCGAVYLDSNGGIVTNTGTTDTIIEGIVLTNYSTNTIWPDPVFVQWTNTPCGGTNLECNVIFFVYNYGGSKTNILAITNFCNGESNTWFQPYIPTSDTWSVYRELIVKALDTNSDPSMTLQYKARLLGGPPWEVGGLDTDWHDNPYNNGWVWDRGETDGSDPTPYGLPEAYFRAYSKTYHTNGNISLWYRWQDNHGNWH